MCSNKTGKHVQLQHSLKWNQQTRSFLLQKNRLKIMKFLIRVAPRFSDSCELLDSSLDNKFSLFKSSSLPILD